MGNTNVNQVVQTSELLRMQFAFTRNVGLLISHAYSLGYTLTLGEGWRSLPETQRLVALNLGSPLSLHPERLAIDFNLFYEGRWLKKTEDFLSLGAFWKSLDPRNAWGGDFKHRKDGNHFSMQYMGRR